MPLGSKPFELAPCQIVVKDLKGKVIKERVLGKCDMRKYLRKASNWTWREIEEQIYRIYEEKATVVISDRTMTVGEVRKPILIEMTAIEEEDFDGEFEDEE